MSKPCNDENQEKTVRIGKCLSGGTQWRLPSYAAGSPVRQGRLICAYTRSIRVWCPRAASRRAEECCVLGLYHHALVIK